MSFLEKQCESQENAGVSPGGRLGRKEQLVETLVFLFLVVPSMAVSLFLVQQNPPQTGFVLTAVMIMLRDLSLVALIFYFLWRSGEPIGWVGWRLNHVWREILLGVLLFVPFFFVNVGIENLFLRLGLSPPRPGAESFLKPHGAGQIALAGVLASIVAITEETIFRGYLLLRLSAVSGSVAFAVILSSLIFSIGHGYEGSAGLATTGVMGLIFAVIYLWRASLVAPVIMHFLQDFLVLVVVSALPT